jgi:glutamyl-tRNA reductase
MQGRKAVLIGLGEMGQTVARLLSEAGASLSVVGRDRKRVELLAQRFSAAAFAMDELSQLLVDADVVVSSTSAPGTVVTLDHLERRRKTRRGGNLFFIDLAVPRDIEPKIGNLDGVFLYDVDDLSQVAVESTGHRRKAADAAETIVEEVVVDWERRESALLVTPTIKGLRAKLRLAMEAELARSLRGRLRGLDLDQREALGKMIDSGINRLLHEPTTRLRDEANQKEGSADDMIALLNGLFELAEVESTELDVSAVRIPATVSMMPPEESEGPGEVEGLSSDTDELSLRGSESGESRHDLG